MKTVMFFGTFDILHKGHLNLFWQAGSLGDKIAVVVARDKTVLKVKNRLPRHNEKERRQMIIDSGLADEVILGSLTDKYAAIKKYKPDIIALGYDQEYLTGTLESELKKLKLKTKVVRLKSYKPSIYKTSKLI